MRTSTLRLAKVKEIVCKPKFEPTSMIPADTSWTLFYRATLWVVNPIIKEFKQRLINVKENIK